MNILAIILIVYLAIGLVMAFFTTYVVLGMDKIYAQAIGNMKHRKSFDKLNDTEKRIVSSVSIFAGLLIYVFIWPMGIKDIIGYVYCDIKIKRIIKKLEKLIEILEEHDKKLK